MKKWITGIYIIVGILLIMAVTIVVSLCISVNVIKNGCESCENCNDCSSCDSCGGVENSNENVDSINDGSGDSNKRERVCV